MKPCIHHYDSHTHPLLEYPNGSQVEFSESARVKNPGKRFVI